VTDGRDPIGHVELRAGKFVAINSKGRVLCRFATLNEALNVFSERRRQEKCDG
jgi:hypothetical protein